MAKGNMFQGMARGKVGDVVFYRMNGVQMSRVRNRAPKNPRSNEQLYQRAVIASVMKAYSSGKEIYDHAFQGYTIGEGCMRRFNSVNARILREKLSIDVNQPRALEQQEGRFVWPKSNYSVPLIGMQVSEGTLNQSMFNLVDDGNVIGQYQIAAPLPANENTHQYFERLGVNPGDIFTFIFHLTNENLVYTPLWTASRYAQGYESGFFWVRFIVRDYTTFGTSDSAVENLNLNQLFEIEMSDAAGFGTSSESVKILNLHGEGKYIHFGGTDGRFLKYSGVSACIRSRLDIDIRSTEYTHVFSNVEANQRTWGIASQYVLQIWQEEVQKIGLSELILEGGESPVSAISMDEDYVDEVQSVNYPVEEGGIRKTAIHRGSMPNTEG